VLTGLSARWRTTWRCPDACARKEIMDIVYLGLTGLFFLATWGGARLFEKL
jgi:hypothetical protein